MGSTEEHQQLVRETLLKVSKRGDARVWQNPTGRARTLDGKRTLSFGLVGSADITGIMRFGGRRLEIECKTGNATQSTEQNQYQAMIEKYGGIYILLRNNEDINALIDARL